MAFEMSLWRVDDESLKPIDRSGLDQEERIETWIAEDSSVLGMDVVVFGRQVHTDFGGRIDLLALDRQGRCVIVELKRQRTPREVVAQLLDYASWVCDLGYDELDQICRGYRHKDLATLFEEGFGETLPDPVNDSHTMVVVAAELDESSERIINYLSEHHDLSINAVFFNFFGAEGTELLGRAWLRDPVETAERSVSRKKPPWSGSWFVNVGEGPHRNWDDNQRYGFVGAGQGARYSRPLRNLRVGDKLFAYMAGRGYVGHGEVVQPAMMIRKFVPIGHDKPLLELPLEAEKASDNSDSEELSEWVVGVNWHKAVARDDARTFKGVFANQNIVCKLRDPRTLEFLRAEFESDEEG